MSETKLAANRSPNWAFMQRFEVPNYDSDGNYLTRWRIVQTPWFGMYLHRFDGPDPRPTLHDHPWDFRSLVLLGGYVEATEYGIRIGDLIPLGAPPDWPKQTLREHGSWETFTRGGINRKKATDLHTIVHLLRVPTWTLMFVGRRERVWGYVDRDGTWTAFNEHRHNLEFENALRRRGRNL